MTEIKLQELTTKLENLEIKLDKLIATKKISPSLIQELYKTEQQITELELEREKIEYDFNQH